MSAIKLDITDFSEFMLWYLAETLQDADASVKDDFNKIFKWGGLRKFQVENKARFIQKYRILTNSLQNKQQTQIVIVADGMPGEITTDKNRPTVTKKILRLLRKLTGTTNESVIELYLQETLNECERIERRENLAEACLIEAQNYSRYDLHKK